MGVSDWFLSNHQPIYLLKKMITTNKKEMFTFIGRTYRNYSTEVLPKKLDNKLNINELLNMENPNECRNKLYGELVDNPKKGIQG